MQIAHCQNANLNRFSAGPDYIRVFLIVLLAHLNTSFF